MDPMDRLDPELVEPLVGLMEATGGFDLSDIPATRAMSEGMLAAVNAEAPPTPGILIEDQTVPSHEAGIDVGIRIYKPEAASSPLPVLLWMHPGGFVIGSIAMNELMARQLAKDLGIAVVSVEYRLAPENPYPAALEDCYGALTWLAANGTKLGITPSRIAIGGASAGANLAAALCLLSRDRNGPKPVYQLLLYPALDDSNTEAASDTVPENLFWSRENARIGWENYLRSTAATDIPAYAAPSRATDLGGLPNAFIAVGTADMFVQENIDYAERLAAAGHEVELKVYPGAFHGFDAFAPMSRLAQQFFADRNDAIRRAFNLIA